MRACEVRVSSPPREVRVSHPASGFRPGYADALANCWGWAGFGLATTRAAVHLRTGERGSDDEIDAWLQRQSATVIGSDDPLDACVQVLTHQHLPVALVFLGGDWLEPDDWRLVDYLRELWPAAACVVHLSRPGVVALSDPLTLVCSSRAELATVLAGDFEQAVEHVRRAARRSEVIETPPGRPEGSATDVAGPGRAAVGPIRSGPHPGVAPPARPAKDESGSSSTAVSADRAEPLRAILTREELEALMRDARS